MLGEGQEDDDGEDSFHNHLTTAGSGETDVELLCPFQNTRSQCLCFLMNKIDSILYYFGALL